MKDKRTLAGAVALAVVALAVALYSGSSSLREPPADPNRFPKPTPEAMAQIEALQRAAEQRNAAAPPR